MGIRQFREAAGMTKTDLARQMGVTHQAVSSWERGVSYPTAANLLQMAEIFRCSVDELLGRDRPPDRSSLSQEEEPHHVAV